MDTSKYFYRNVIFSKQGKSIYLIDLNNPTERKEELEQWFGIVFQLADGQHTLEELYQFIVRQYKDEVPPNLSDTLKSVVERMEAAKLIVLTEIETELPYYLSMPYEMLDMDKLQEALKKDSII